MKLMSEDAERLVQAQTLWAMRDPALPLREPAWGPGPASGWNCSERARNSGKSSPSTVPS